MFYPTRSLVRGRTVAMVNAFWCDACGDGYQAAEPGCPKCGVEAKTVAEPSVVEPENNANAHLACGALVVIAGLFGGGGLVLGFFIWG